MDPPAALQLQVADTESGVAVPGEGTPGQGPALHAKRVAEELRAVAVMIPAEADELSR